MWRFLKKLGIKLPWWWWWWCLIVSDSCHHRTVAHQAFLSMGFLRQEYWSELPFLSPGDLPSLRIKHGSPESQVDSLPLSHLGRLQREANEGIQKPDPLASMGDDSKGPFHLPLKIC